MNRIIILIILISFNSCKSQDKEEKFKTLSELNDFVLTGDTNEGFYKSLDSLKNHVDGADAEFYLEIYKNAIIYDTDNLKNHLIKSKVHLDEDVIDYFSQSKDILDSINKSINRIYPILLTVIDSDGYVNLRKEAYSHSEIITQINSYEKVNLIDSIHNWKKVYFNGSIGYIFYDRLTVNKDEVSNVILKYSTGYNSLLIYPVKIDNNEQILETIIQIKNNNGSVQNIEFKPPYWYKTTNLSVESFFFPKKSLIKTNYGVEKYSNLVFADYNFDGLEDFAITKEEGGNGGPIYIYYFQNKIGNFEIDQYLSNEMGYFPIEINNKERTLKFSHPIDCCKISTTKIQMESNGKWSEVFFKVEEMN